MAYVYYNLTNYTSAGNDTSLLTFANAANVETSGLAGILVILMVYVVLFLALKARGYPAPSCFAATSFVGMLMGIIMYPMGLATGTTLLVSVLMFPLSLAVLWVLYNE